ncbi:lactoferrin/transferrin family TonB-dependent receptor, partial [Glaesserella parasuis]
KGASSSEFGSGSLGGSVQFRTKEVSDIIKPGQSWGLDTKSAYSSKNQQWLNSLAFAGTHNGFDALVIYTHRDGKETKAHKDAESRSKRIQRAALADNNPQDSNWFIVKNDCPSLNCEPRQQAKVSYDGQKYLTEQLSAKEYTGEERALPDPVKYKSDSWLVKLG